MKKIETTYNKIVADEELKSRIAGNLLSQAATEQPDVSNDAPVKIIYKQSPCSKRRRLNFRRIMATAASFLLVLVLGVQPLLHSSSDLPNNTNPATGGNEITDPGGNPVGGEIGGGIINPLYTDLSPKTMPPVTLSREELIDKLYSDDPSGSGDGGSDWAEDSPSEAEKGSEEDYAKTNVQHEGVDEGDIIKVDGGYIYSLSQEGLVIVSVSDIMEVTCKIKYANFYPDEMFIFGDRLIVIGGQYTQYYYNQSGGDGWADDSCMVPWYGYRSSTRVIVYDLKDRIKVEKLCEYDITGYFITSRLIDGRLIWAVNYDFNRWDKNGLFPKINGEDIAAENVYLYDNGYNYYYRSYTIIASLNLNSLKANATAHLGLYGISYFSKDNVYFFNNGYAYEDESEEYSYRYYYYTVIIKINLGSLLYAASAKLDGHVNDRYWADEYQNNLRVVTHYYESSYYPWGGSTWIRHTNLFVLDNNLNTMGTIIDIASGENLHSVRFRGDEGSIVTYLQVDPLFKLDLSDPENPKISKGLKEEGVSDYLQYLSDDVILGLGRGNELKGMKVALYDNTGPDAVNMKTIGIGKGSISSEALWNPKAILNDPAKNMFSFAATDYGPYNYNTGYLLYSQGLHVFEYNLNAAGNSDKLIYKGLLSNITPNRTYKNWYDYYDDYFSYVKRGARIGNKIYTISERYITSYDINSLQLIQRLQISNIHYHRMDGKEVIIPATCDTNGSIKYHCTYKDCDYTETQVLWAAGCDWGDWEITTQPAQTKSGTETRVCKRDKSHTEMRKIAAGGLVISPDGGGGYIITHNRGAGAAVVIPSFVDGLPVTRIGPYAFNSNTIESITFASGSMVQKIDDYAFAYSYALNSIALPDSMIEIGNGAFYDCFKLDNIVLPDSVTKIGNYAFNRCYKLKIISLPDGLTQIGNGAFSGCSNLSIITIPKDVTRIESNTFSGCTSLDKIDLPEDLTQIGYSAFNSCTSLSGITIPDGVTRIYSNTFYNCINLSKISLPSGVTHIDSGVFDGCSKLKEIILPDNLIQIGYGAFSYCSGLNSIKIPDKVTYIGSNAFSYCTSLSNIIIPDGITSIGSYTFQNCSALTELIIPDGVTFIGDGAFYGCSNLKEITIPNEATQIYGYTFYNCVRLTKIFLPNGVASIGNYAFYNCAALTEMIIPDSVKYIGNYAFYCCRGIKEITIPATLAQVCYGVFYGWNESQTIYVKGHTQKPMGWFMDWNEQCNAKIVWED